jgi:Na+/H+ antiporter NhaA
MQAVTAVDSTDRTPWSDYVRTPVRAFLRTEASSAAVLLAAAVVALVWANADATSYDHFWAKALTISFGHHTISQTLQGWVNDGLMTFFFFVVGLEARREFDLGELRERQRLALPVIAGLAGMAVPAGIFLAINAGHSTAHGWGAAMSTDTAFTLGLLALVGPKFPDRLRAFVLTVLVVDDIAALVIIATVYPEDVNMDRLVEAIALWLVILVIRTLRVRGGLLYLTLGSGVWLLTYLSGVDPVVVGLSMGLLTVAYPAARPDLERATESFRLFREQPTGELARQARAQVQAALSPNERLSQLWHPWTSYVIVPLFALANTGIPLNATFLGNAFSSRVAMGIFIAYSVGKPVGISGAAWLVTTVSRGRLRPPVGWASVLGTGTSAGIGFTVSLLIASLAFHGTTLQYAKVGVLAAAVTSSLLSLFVFRSVQLLPTKQRAAALLGTSTAIVDLADPVDPDRDHIRGPSRSLVTMVEYGDLECPYCGQAEPIVRELLREHGDIRYVWRHLPLDDVHPHARMAAEATEAAGEQGAFWEMHDLLFAHQDALRRADLIGYAEELRLDVERFIDDLDKRSFARRVESDLDSAALSGVSGTPTFFVNGRRHQGAYDLASLTAVVKAERARAAMTTQS